MFKTLFTVLFALCWCTFLLAQEAPNARDNIYEGNFDYSQVDPNWVYTTTDALALLYDNGPAFNIPGGHTSGADLSLLETALGMNTLGAGHQWTLGYRVADEFTVPTGETWTIDSLIFYAYQTNSTTTSTMTGVYFQIWDGDPSAGGTIIWGDLTTNRLSNTYWSNIYRASDNIATNRPMMRNVGTTPALVLTEGTYWIDWSTDGSLASGPWAPPIVILGSTTTGNAQQFVTGWLPLTDSGTLTPLGLPFEVWGTSGGGGGPEPEMSLTHTPGDLNVGIFNTGAIGTEQLGATGPGVTWKGENGLYMGGVLFGDAASASVNGVFGAFTSGGNPVLNDLKNVSSNFAGGFMSDANFDQITEAVFYDSVAPVPYNTEIIQRSYSNTGDDFVFIRYGFINRSGSTILSGTPGIAIDWDVGDYTTNSGGYGLLNSFVYQWDTGPTSSYYFGMAALDGAGGVRATPESAFGPPFSDVRLNIYSWITTFDAAIQPDGDFRSYIGSAPNDYPIGDTVWTTFAIVAGDDLNQITANALNASVKAYNLGWTAIVIPVELTSFTANVNHSGQVELNWSTATETNNQLFEIERRTAEGQFATIGYVEGHGTTTEPQNYSYTDVNVNTGIYFYRLKQLDFLGYYEYFDEIEVDVTGPLTFALEQNYPNPFNPSTNIKYSVPETGDVRLSVYNLIGEEVAVLVDGFSEAGFFEVTFDASSLSSGAYFYKLQSGNSVVAKKMLLMK